jgi:hypothetical protein
MRKVHAGRMKTGGGGTKPKKMVERRRKFAAALDDARYRQRVVKSVKTHNRKSKPPVPVDENE